MAQSKWFCNVCHCENSLTSKACLGCHFGRNENENGPAALWSPHDPAVIVHQKLLALANLKTEPICEGETNSWELGSPAPWPVSMHDGSNMAVTAVKRESTEDSLVTAEGRLATEYPFSVQFEPLEETVLLKKSPVGTGVQESPDVVAVEKKPLELQSRLCGVHQLDSGKPVDLSLKATVLEGQLGLNHNQGIAAGTTGQKASEASGEDYTKTRPFACEICSVRYVKRADLTRHIRSHTGEKPFPCPHCSARFARKTYVQSHIRTHTGERPFACRHCDAKFAEKGARTVHERTHTGEKPYACTFCDARFAKAYNMKRHVRSHTGFKPFECSECQAKFSDSGDLKKHQVIHTGVRPFICSVCDGRFLRKHDLRSHQITHKNDKVYECDVCGMMFARVTYLQRHMKVHGRVGRRIKKLEELDLADPDAIFDTRDRVDSAESRDESVCENSGSDVRSKPEKLEEPVGIQKFSFPINRLNTAPKSKPKCEKPNDRSRSDDREKSPQESRDGSSEYNPACQTVV